MVHTAFTISCRSNAPNSKIQEGRIFAFASLVQAKRHRPQIKQDLESDHSAEFAVYLHPSPDTVDGHNVVRCDYDESLREVHLKEVFISTKIIQVLETTADGRQRLVFPKLHYSPTVFSRGVIRMKTAAATD